jgi:hypothetical protein
MLNKLFSNEDKAPKPLDFEQILRKETARNGLIYARTLLNDLGATTEQKKEILTYFVQGLNGLALGDSLVFDSDNELTISEDNIILIKKVEEYV